MTKEERTDLEQKLKEDRIERESLCLMAVKQALSDHNCKIDVIVTLEGDKLNKSIKILAQ